MNRRYDFDWLRVFGAVLVVFAHVSLLFCPWSPTPRNVQTSKIISEILWNLNLWLMPLFMILAGSSAWFALRKRSNRQYLLERIGRLSVPFLILMVIAVVPETYMEQTWLGQYRGSLGNFYLQFLNGHFAFLHLWFLAYLHIRIRCGWNAAVN